MFKKIISAVLLCALAVISATNALGEDEPVSVPDELRLVNGSVILGKVLGARDGAVNVETDFAGTLSIKYADIESINTRDTSTLQLVDGTVLRDKVLQVRDQQILVSDEAGVSSSYAVEQLAVLNPEPWELGETYKWSGVVSFAMAIERGNSDTDEMDFKVESVWKHDVDRYTLKGNGEIDEANGVKNTDNWNIIGKYDHFTSEYSYYGANAYVESDEFADLDLRYFIGPYIGREFLHDPLFTLGAEVGLSYVNETFKVAEDQDYPGANWNLRMKSNYLGGNSSLYFDQIGIWNLDETSDIIINTTVGLSFPLLWSLEAAAEILLEYDSGAVEGVEEVDQTYNFRIGYTW